jgi:hypothetical protein
MCHLMARNEEKLCAGKRTSQHNYQNKWKPAPVRLHLRISRERVLSPSEHMVAHTLPCPEAVQGAAYLLTKPARFSASGTPELAARFILATLDRRLPGASQILREF